MLLDIRFQLISLLNVISHPHRWQHLSSTHSRHLGHLCSRKRVSPSWVNMVLADDFESCAIIRNVARQHGALLRWPDSKSTGVASMKACSLNSRQLDLTTKWWVRFAEQPGAIPIDLLRTEAHLTFTRLNMHTMLIMSKV